MSVSLCGDWAVIGAPSPKAQNKTGSIYLFKQVGESWIEHTRLLASDGQAADRFGYSVSMTGDWVIVGASGDDDLGDSAGSVYLFKREGDTWIEHTKLLSSFGQTMDLFGSSVSVNGDWAIVGSPRYWNDPNNTGSAYLFKYEGDIWMESVRLFAPDDRLGVEFGLAVALESDKVIVASRRDKENGENAGAAYIFARLAQAGLSGY